MMAAVGREGSMGASVRTIPAMGRPFRLGMLYDCCRDQLIPNRTLWTDVLIEEHTKLRTQAESDLNIMENATLNEKAAAIGMDHSLKLSFLAGTMNVEGSGKVLKDGKLKTNTASVTIHHTDIVDARELDMNDLEKIHDAQSVVDETQCTHVVTSIQYGSQGFLVFNTEYGEARDKPKAVIKLKTYVDRLTKKRTDQAELEGIQCSYYGDHMSDGCIVTYETIVHTYESIITKNLRTTADAKPIKVWLYPLCKLNLKISGDIRDISSNLTNEIQDVVEQIHECEMQSQGLMKTKCIAFFPAFMDSLCKFQKTLQSFTEELKLHLAAKVPSVRRSEAEEVDLTNLLGIKEDSPFSNIALQSWMDGKRKEIRLLDSYLKILKDVDLVRDETELDCLSIENDCVICLVLNLGRGEDPFLADMTTFLQEQHLRNGRKKSNQAAASLPEPSNHDRRLQQSITPKVKEFIQYFKANMSNHNIKFVTMLRHASDGTDKSKDIGAHITVTKDMTIQCEDFQVPSEPGQPSKKATTSESITLAWDKPEKGHEYVDHYDVQYREAAGTVWHMTSTEDAKETITVHDLNVETPYQFQVRVACTDSVANFGKISNAFTTFNPPSSPRNVNVVKVEGTTISVDWRKPEYRAEMTEIYEIQHKSVDDIAWMRAFTNEAKCTASLENLIPGRHYEVRVRAVNAEGVGPFGDVGQPIAIFNPPSDAGKPITTGATGSTLDIEWSRPEHRHENIHHYEVEYRVAGRAEWAVFETDNALLHATIKGLLEQTDYECRVRAICEKGSGIFGPISDAIATGRVLLDPPDAPEALLPVCCTTHSIALSWYRPKHGYEMVTDYEIHFKPEAQQEWHVQQSDGPREEAKCEGLEEDTTYEFRVRAVCDTDRCVARDGPFGKTEAIKTDITLGRKIMKSSQPHEQACIPRKYKVPVERCLTSTEMKTRKCTFGEPQATCTGKLEKTIMLVGATGSGKSTLIDGMINYIAKVRFEDDFRLNLVDLMEDEMKNDNQAVSQTEWITLYTIPPMEGGSLDFTLNIIDTPGFGDTRGIQRDKQLVDQIREFFKDPGDDGVQVLDGVCFVTQAPLARLSQAQRYIYDAIQAVFGKDVASNIFILITFADGNRPPVIDALKEANISDSGNFKFNNSALFADNTETDANQFASMFWDLGKESFDQFFTALQSTESRSLTLTAEVLSERESLEVTIQGLLPRIREGMLTLDSLRQEVTMLRQHKAEIKANKNFTYAVDQIKQEKTNLEVGTFVTNCLICNFTCHYPCFIADDSKKYHCAAMDRAHGKDHRNCTVCPKHCHWEQHVNNQYLFKITSEKVQRTYHELKKRYETAEGHVDSSVSLIDRIGAEFMDLQENVCCTVETARKSINRLGEIALKPNPLSMVQYIDLLIQSERSEAKAGFMKQISMLTSLRESAKLTTDLQNENFNPWGHMLEDLLEDTSDSQVGGLCLSKEMEKHGFVLKLSDRVITWTKKQFRKPKD